MYMLNAQRVIRSVWGSAGATGSPAVYLLMPLAFSELPADFIIVTYRMEKKKPPNQTRRECHRKAVNLNEKALVCTDPSLGACAGS